MASNGSVAPIAPDFSCALRTIRALRDEYFDVVHLHEPIVPGPTVTALVFTEVPTIGTFHRAGESGVYRAFCDRWPGGPRAPGRCAAPCPRTPSTPPPTTLGGRVRAGVQRDRDRAGTPKRRRWPTTGPTIVFVGRHEPRKGLTVLLEAMAELGPDVRLWVASDGPQTPRLRSPTATIPRIEWLGRISDEEQARRLRGADVLCAPSLARASRSVSSCSRPWRRRPPIVASRTSPGTATWPGRTSKPCWWRRATRPPWPRTWPGP